MNGRVVTFNNEANEGVIRGNNGSYYQFHIGEWLSDKPIKIGTKVQFKISDKDALDIAIFDQFHLLRNLKFLYFCLFCFFIILVWLY
jgi:cold shock CspA family protein